MKPYDFPLINALHISEYTPEAYIAHLKSIIRHDRHVKVQRKVAAKVQREKFAGPPAKAYSFRVNDKGTGVLTIRGRKPAYLTVAEHAELLKIHHVYTELINTTILRRKIVIKNV